MPDPLTLSWSGSFQPQPASTARTWTANASLSSTSSMSRKARPVRENSFCTGVAGGRGAAGGGGVATGPAKAELRGPVPRGRDPPGDLSKPPVRLRPRPAPSDAIVQNLVPGPGAPADRGRVVLGVAHRPGPA